MKRLQKEKTKTPKSKKLKNPKAKKMLSHTVPQLSYVGIWDLVFVIDLGIKIPVHNLKKYCITSDHNYVINIDLILVLDIINLPHQYIQDNTN